MAFAEQGMDARWTRRRFVASAAVAVSAISLPLPGEVAAAEKELPLRPFGYDQVRVTGERQVSQRENVCAVLRDLNDDSLLKPFRSMAGQAAPGESLGGWYEWKPDYNYHHDDAGLAPGASFGQWTSALARLHAASRFDGGAGDVALAAQATRLNGLLATSIAPAYFAQTRFAGYTLDKLLCGLVDAHTLLGDGSAFATLDKVVEAARPSLPGGAVDREVQWRPGADLSWMWDETYTLPENLYRAAAAGADKRYVSMADAYLADRSFFEPLSRNVNVLGDRHAYSYVNSLCSAMQAYFTHGDAMHLEAARNGFALLQQQSFATGGWGPDELLRKPGYDELSKSLTASHNSFEVPCGSFAHMKLTRYLLQATRDGRYADSMERVLWNAILGALPLQPDGRSFYSADYSTAGRRVYSVHRWPCCSGTLPQAVADYGINTYLQGDSAIWVTLYQPSELRWSSGGKALRLRQTGAYPYEDTVQLRVTASQPAAFSLRLRIPAWAAETATLQVNGGAVPLDVNKGFASVNRVWRSGDTVALRLPMTVRLEALPPDGLGHSQRHRGADVWPAGAVRGS